MLYECSGEPHNTNRRAAGWRPIFRTFDSLVPFTEHAGSTAKASAVHSWGTGSVSRSNIDHPNWLIFAVFPSSSMRMPKQILKQTETASIQILTQSIIY